MKYKIIALIVITLSLSSLKENGFAQESERYKEGLFKTEVSSYSMFMPYSLLDNAPGKVGIMEYGIAGGYECKIPPGIPVILYSQFEKIDIEKTIDMNMPSHLYSLANDIDTIVPFFFVENTYLDIGVSPSFYSDDYSFDIASFRVPMRAFAIWRPNEKWTLIAGAAWYPRYDLEFLPIAGVIYKPNEKLIFNITPAKPTISYMVNDRLKIFLEAGYRFNSEYVVSRNNTTNVVLTYDYLRTGGGIEYKISKYLYASVTSGGVFDRSLAYRDCAGKADIDKNFYATCTVTAKS